MTKVINKNLDIFFCNLDNKIKLPDILLKYSESDDVAVLNRDEYNKLILYKNKIDLINNNKLWDKSKKISNDYELIYLPNKNIKSESISKYEPLSRSYFKLWEILCDYKLLDQKKHIRVGALAEGPGGFIEACINYRKKYLGNCNLLYNDNIYAITLKSINKDIPGWNKAKNYLKRNPNIHICYGKDDTGNIYNMDNILNFSKNFNHDADFITADGGFDFSYNFNKQEQLSYRIIFCEIVTALNIQKKGGSFICKFYDMYTQVTASIIYLLISLYDYVYIDKPYTSRPANSEKYIICKGFKGIDDLYLRKLGIVVRSMEFIDNNKFHINKIFNIDEDNIIYNKLIKMNTYFFNTQINNIIKTINIIDMENNNTLDKNSIVKKQTTYAFSWCKKYTCKINYDSKYLIKKTY